MTPGDITGRTRAIGAPVNWDVAKDGTCGVLCVRDGVEGRHPTMTSAWFPDANDLAFLAKGLPITLTIFGSVHPVVSLGIGQPSDLAAAAQGETSPPKAEYRLLREGEIIQEGDEVTVGNMPWEMALHIGTQAPDPSSPYNCVFRRPTLATGGDCGVVSSSSADRRDI